VSEGPLVMRCDRQTDVRGEALGAGWDLVAQRLYPVREVEWPNPLARWCRAMVAYVTLSRSAVKAMSGPSATTRHAGAFQVLPGVRVRAEPMALRRCTSRAGARAVFVLLQRPGPAGVCAAERDRCTDVPWNVLAIGSAT